jgi:hypothetical protein
MRSAELAAWTGLAPCSSRSRVSVGLRQRAKIFDKVINSDVPTIPHGSVRVTARTWEGSQLKAGATDVPDAYLKM